MKAYTAGWQPIVSQAAPGKATPTDAQLNTFWEKHADLQRENETLRNQKSALIAEKNRLENLLRDAGVTFNRKHI